MYNQQRLKKVALMLMMSMLCLISFAQERQVQGIVKDKSGEPMIGVNVLVKEGVSKCTPSVFYAQSPDFHKLGLCYYLKILYL